ncbi:hypothetical protein [Natranaerofaba carboxydovora]|uniref:hypothetical protein n=1 Tax=Natranaerofaba carboxydovora TaxID=2742683 RepID=UPI001F1346A6|nr:hypothetical protein [Natranaerofaba carboxydovora]
MEKFKRMFSGKSKAKKALLTLIIYRGAKILALYLIFWDRPIIWMPTVITTSILLFFNIRSEKRQLLKEDKENQNKKDH